jgi:hypothetical protein
MGLMCVITWETSWFQMALTTAVSVLLLLYTENLSEDNSIGHDRFCKGASGARAQNLGI